MTQIILESSEVKVSPLPPSLKPIIDSFSYSVIIKRAKLLGLPKKIINHLTFCKCVIRKLLKELVVPPNIKMAGFQDELVNI